ncbi:TadE/TadG family type IV pilus assembly protein [Streptomyces sp. NBC_01264]|uniref:TadE/TadG family type IV pilus assembly protein n=1 Tax=Streptomyces sp. NBC_01264 TaxID=2903804 RepID=UPI0022510B43|nr:TadE family protein [Streptomyces sp. NBC_01264]MCX4780702.1 pilus assembly protein [Streptomyces sp. NBC_01264]
MAFEFVGMLPFILLIVVAVWQCVLIGYAYSLVGNAADEAAREGAVHGDAACDAAGRKYISGGWDNVTVNCTPSGNLYKATVSMNLRVLFRGFDIGVPITGHGGSLNELEED